jgi:hypothetical protein
VPLKKYLSKIEEKKMKQRLGLLALYYCVLFVEAASSCRKGNCPEKDIGPQGPRGPPGPCPTSSLEGNMTVNDGSRCGVSKLISTYGDPGVNIGASWATTVVFGPQVDIPSLELTNDLVNNVFVVQESSTGRLKKLNNTQNGGGCQCNSATETVLQREDQHEGLTLTPNNTTFHVIPGMTQVLGIDDFFQLSSNPTGLPRGEPCENTEQCTSPDRCCVPPHLTRLSRLCRHICQCIRCTQTTFDVQLSATIQLDLLQLNQSSVYDDGAVVELAFFMNETMVEPPFQFMLSNSTEVDTSVLASIVLSIEDVHFAFANTSDPDGNGDVLFSTRIRYSSESVPGTSPGYVHVGSSLQTDPNHGVLNTIASLDTVDNETLSVDCTCSTPISPSSSSSTERSVGSFSRNSSVVCGTSSSIASLSFDTDGNSHLSTEAFGPVNLTSLGSTLQVSIILDDFSILTSQTFTSTTSAGLQEKFASSNITPGTIAAGSHTISLECSLVGGTLGTGIVSATSTNQAQLNFFLL